MSEHDDPKRLNRETQQIWDANARFWDARFGEGNNFQRLLIGPATERLLALRPGELVLDAACGNGAFSRRMAELGAQVVAFDFSEQFLELARARTAERPDLAGRIEYHQIDATDRAQLLALGSGRFDAAVCTMAVMDMAEIDPLLSAASQLLKPGGRFVFSVTHPCFSTTTMRKVVEEEDRGGELVTTYAVKISRYITPTTAKGLGMIGQPLPQLYFDRPLSLILGACFAAGFVLDGLEEPVFPEGADANRPFSWENFREIPPVLVARLILKP
jgi:2-polyprenyl-3-methyl-5-hydroxy-6-metoxy-1,4-benzoquinol methylase